jgi:hypothetical protein
MTTPLAEFNRIRYEFRTALAKASAVRINVWSLYGLALSHDGTPKWVFIDHYPSEADAKLACPKDSHTDHLIIQEGLSAADRRYDASEFAAPDSTDHFDGLLAGPFKIFPAQMWGGEPVRGQAHWIPCRAARAGGRATALCPKPVDWVDGLEVPPDSCRVTIAWAN